MSYENYEFKEFRYRTEPLGVSSIRSSIRICDLVGLDGDVFAMDVGLPGVKPVFLLYVNLEYTGIYGRDVHFLFDGDRWALVGFRLWTSSKYDMQQANAAGLISWADVLNDNCWDIGCVPVDWEPSFWWSNKVVDAWIDRGLGSLEISIRVR